MSKHKKIDDAEYAAFLNEIKDKINDFQNLFGKDIADLERMAEVYEKLCFEDKPQAEIHKIPFTEKYLD